MLILALFYFFGFLISFKSYLGLPRCFPITLGSYQSLCFSLVRKNGLTSIGLLSGLVVNFELFLDILRKDISYLKTKDK